MREPGGGAVLPGGGDDDDGRGRHYEPAFSNFRDNFAGTLDYILVRLLYSCQITYYVYVHTLPYMYMFIYIHIYIYIYIYIHIYTYICGRIYICIWV
jgi:hypothetical protein